MRFAGHRDLGEWTAELGFDVLDVHRNDAAGGSRGLGVSRRVPGDLDLAIDDRLAHVLGDRPAFADGPRDQSRVGITAALTRRGEVFERIGTWIHGGTWYWTGGTGGLSASVLLRLIREEHWRASRQWHPERFVALQDSKSARLIHAWKADELKARGQSARAAGFRESAARVA
jgi:hypothetical protein